MAGRRAASPALAFYTSSAVAEVAAAQAWSEAHAALVDPDAELEPAWTRLALPIARVHPRAPALFADAAGVRAEALQAVIASDAYIDDAGVLRAWPWYPEEDAVERPRAESTCPALGLALPAELLDEPYQPAYYLARSGLAALEAWLRTRGVDPAIARVASVPLPPRARDVVGEGGLRAEPPAVQATRALRQAVRLWDYAETDELRAEVARRIDRALAQLFAAVAQLPAPRGDVPAVVEAPRRNTDATEVGRVIGIRAVARGALLVAEGALIEIDHVGAFVRAWPALYGDVFARDELVFVEDAAVLDLATGAFVAAGAPLAPLLARVGLAQVPAIGYVERGEPRLSACGRYVLDLDETPVIRRIADGVAVAEGQSLERALGSDTDANREPRRPRGGKALVSAAQVETVPATVIEGVRFVVRAGQSAVRDGDALAFALAGPRWRFLCGERIREGGKTLARVGVPVSAGAFTPDGATLWVLSADHAIRIELAQVPRAAVIAPLAPVLAAAAREVRDA